MTHLLTSFAHKPKGVRFETQEEEEEILLFLRQHLITVVPWVIWVIVLAFLPLIWIPLLMGASLFEQPVPMGYFLVLPLVWYTGVLGFALTQFMHWYFNIYIVTTQRIIDIDFVNLLFKAISSAELSKIEDVTFEQGGFFHSFFDFGDVFIQTAGKTNYFEFEKVARPDIVVKRIAELTE